MPTPPVGDPIDRVRATIHTHHLLDPGQTVIAGVSGGPDSVALLHLLYRLASEMQLDLHVAHLDHGLRGEESRMDARFVREMADSWGIPLHVKAVDTARHAAHQGISIEEAARYLRFDWFAAVCEQLEATRVALAHTLDDQVETVLYRLARGAAGPGLLGISYRRPLSPAYPQVEVVHPLLDERREYVLEYCRRQGLPFRLDPTNRDESIPRNYLRHRVVPLLLALNPHLHETVRRNLAILAEEHRYLEAEARHLVQELQCNPQTASEWELDRRPLGRRPIALQRRALYQILREFTGEQVAFYASHLEALRELFLSPRGGGEVHLPQGRVARREGDTIRLLPEQAPPVPSFQYDWQDDGLLVIPELRCRVQVSCLDSPPDDLEHPPPDMAYFSGEDLPRPLVWRNWRPGDRIAPWGMEGHRRVSRWLSDRHVPRRERSRVLLLASGGEVLWIAGRRRSCRAPVVNGTRIILRVRVERDSRGQVV